MIGHLFPVLDYWWFYAAFTGLVVAFLALDLGVFHRKTHVIGVREASAWTAVWAGLALLFCVGLYKYAVWNFGATTGKKIGVEFLTGYVVEWSLRSTTCLFSRWCSAISELPRCYSTAFCPTASWSFFATQALVQGPVFLEPTHRLTWCGTEANALHQRLS